MTCIVGLVDSGKVYLGADSFGGSEHRRVIRADEKVFSVGEFLFGYTSSFRMGQLLRFSLAVPEQPAGMDDFHFLVTTFIQAVRDCLKAGGYAKKKDEEESAGQFIFAYRGGLYEVDSDYQVGISVQPYVAVGAGAEFALGALYALDGLGYSPEMIISTALQAAAEHCAYVAEPFLIKSLEWTPKEERGTDG